ncbi:hypothetical protein KUCAC02_015613, partial [Chaenocephalus aceratus]
IIAQRVGETQTCQTTAVLGPVEEAGAFGSRQHKTHHTELAEKGQDAHQEAGGAGQEGFKHEGAAAREHRYLKRRLEQLSVSGSSERIRTDSMGSTISTDSEQDVDIEGMEFTPGEVDSVDSISDGEEEEDHYSLQSSSSDTSYTATHSHRLQPHHC